MDILIHIFISTMTLLFNVGYTCNNHHFVRTARSATGRGCKVY